MLLDFSPKVIKQMIIDYVIHLRDERGIKCGSIKVHLAAILYFFHINNDDFNLTIRTPYEPVCPDFVSLELVTSKQREMIA